MSNAKKIEYIKWINLPTFTLSLNIINYILSRN